MSELKIAKALKKPQGYESVYLPLDMLDPIAKIFEPVLYETVKKSIKNHGLYHPLVVYPITVDEWWDDAHRDTDQIPPPLDKTPLLYRVQCGCNRLYALQELDYDGVEVIVTEDKKESWELCRIMRIDKRWQRGENFEIIRGKQ